MQRGFLRGASFPPRLRDLPFQPPLADRKSLADGGSAVLQSTPHAVVEIPNHIRHLFEPAWSLFLLLLPLGAGGEEGRGAKPRSPVAAFYVWKNQPRKEEESLRPSVVLGSVPFVILVPPELGKREVKMKVGQNGEGMGRMMMMGESAVVRTS